MKKDIEEYCRICDDCQRRGPSKKNNLIYLIEPLNPFDHWEIDLVGPLPVTERENRYIIIVTDYFTRWSEVKLTKQAITSVVADFIYDEIICRYGPQM